MERKILFTPTADEQFTALENAPSKVGLLDQVRKALGYLEVDPHHPGLHTHEFLSLMGASGEKVFEAYVQNKTPGAYRIFLHYGPDEIKGKKRIPVITGTVPEPACRAARRRLQGQEEAPCTLHSARPASNQCRAASGAFRPFRAIGGAGSPAPASAGYNKVLCCGMGGSRFFLEIWSRCT
jgi:hypothetical protein